MLLSAPVGAPTSFFYTFARIYLTSITRSCPFYYRASTRHLLQSSIFFPSSRDTSKASCPVNLQSALSGMQGTQKISSRGVPSTYRFPVWEIFHPQRLPRNDVADYPICSKSYEKRGKVSHSRSLSAAYLRLCHLTKGCFSNRCNSRPAPSLRYSGSGGIERFETHLAIPNMRGFLKPSYPPAA